MKILLRIVLVLAALSCYQDEALRLPVAPNPPLPPVPPSGPPIPAGSRGTVWILVVEDSGVCVDSASATVLRGQGIGQTVQQVTPCGVWDYDGGILFKDLTPGVAMTLRVSAVGHVAQEMTVLPSLGAYTARSISLAKLP